MISDRQIQLSLSRMVAWSLWGATATCLILAVIVHNGTPEGQHSNAFMLAVAGLAFSAGAATAHMRSFLVSFSQQMRDAFELGREVERENQRDLRSVR